jgi:hypothetical protein
MPASDTSSIGALSYAHKDVVAIVLVALLIGFVIWLLDVVGGLLDRRVRLDERQRSRLALAAPYFTVHSFRDGDLTGRRPLGRLWVRHLLRKDWGIRDEASAVERLEGPRALRPPQRPALPGPDAAARGPGAGRPRHARLGRHPLPWVGPLLLHRRLRRRGDGVALRRGRRLAGAPRLRQLEEWGRAFLDGRVLWGGEARSYYEIVVKKLLEDSNSVWNRISWQEARSG